MSSSSSASEQVTASDQAQINKFARLNNRAEEAKATIARLRKDVQNLTDAEEAVGEREVLGEDGEEVMLQVGDSLLHYSPEALLPRLAKDKEAAEAEALGLEEEAAGLRREMDALKAALYAKFGKAINLDHDDE